MRYRHARPGFAPEFKHYRQRMPTAMTARHRTFALIAAIAALPLSACTTARPAGPIEVTRFIAPDSRAQLGDTTLRVETAPGSEEQGLAMLPYTQAVARELSTFGYAENARPAARQLASVSVEREQLTEGGRSSPVSVGAGGSAGSYGSGVGLGVGINLGGGADERVITRLFVSLRDVTSGTVLWEGRARLDAPVGSRLAQSDAVAAALAEALFRGFPGNSGETIEVEVNP